QGLQARVEAIGGNFDAAFVLKNPNVCIRQRFDDFVEFLRRQGQRARLRDRCSAFTAQPDFEIGREKADLAVTGVHQDVGEDGNRVLALDNSLKKLQFSQ